MRVVIYILIVLVFASCEKQTTQSLPQIYEGPLRTLEDVVMLHSDSAVIQAKVKAAKIYLLQNEDREVPEGLFIEFLDREGRITATLKANYAYFFHEEDRWRAEGNVIVDNIENQETLRTEELYWEPQKGDVYTEKFVKIESPGEVITGTGLNAKQDFSTWTLDHPEGIFEIEDEEGEL